MDKLSEHAIRMLEIADKPYRNEYGMINKDLQDKHDIARAVYDTILQVQVLKTALLHKTEPNCSEKPNNCKTCKHNKLEWYSEVCDGCSKAHSKYEPKTEPQTRCPKCGKRGYIRSLESMGVKLKHFDEYKWKCTNCNRYFKEEPKDEPQTDCAWKGGE